MHMGGGGNGGNGLLTLGSSESFKGRSRIVACVDFIYDLFYTSIGRSITIRLQRRGS